MKLSKLLAATFITAAITACFTACSNGSEKIVEDTVSLGSIDQISTDISSTDLRIKLGNENSVHYKVYESLVPTVSEKDGKLKISSKKQNRSFSFNNSEKSYIEVTLDKKQLDSIDIKLSSGDLDINDIELSGKIKTRSGDININNSSSQKDISIEASSGNIFLKKCSFSSLDSTTASGDVSLDNVHSNKTTFNTQSGDISIDNSDIRNIVTICKSGDVTLELNGNEEDFNYDLSVNSGSIKIGNNSYGDKFSQNNNAENSIKCNTSSGDIKIRFD